MTQVSDLLFLSHRIPYPPNKGDKIRSFHWLKALASRYRVHLGAFVDDESDWAHASALRDLCASQKLIRLEPRLAKLRSAAALSCGQPLTIRYFGDGALRRWVEETHRAHPAAHTFVYSSGVAPYAIDARPGTGRRIVDFCDVDSAKWAEYARRARWPMRSVYLREARTLGRCELEWVRKFDVTLVSSDVERDLLAGPSSPLLSRVQVLGNGVDTRYFDPGVKLDRPFPAQARAVVFTGAMDYLANVDAVRWFCEVVWPAVIAREPRATFTIVGSKPTSEVRALGRMPGVTVTGTVPDVRPYLAHAACIVVPLRIARGIQNKVLEALAMDRPIVTTPAAVQGLGSGSAIPGMLVAERPEEFSSAVVQQLLAADRSSAGGRRVVESSFAWTTVLQRFMQLFEADRAACA